ncbi:tetratricopeptide repeat protein [Roseivirga sp. BDSF3-8]|uniref:tetratricopeptide repeat protein n=1 Tax=Roseivirga sp. BDSF3-8 TaxID=3241598 RepID=UPI0035322DE3
MRKLILLFICCATGLISYAQPPETLLQTAQQLMNSGKFAEAKRLYEIVLKNDPERYIAAYRLAEIHEQQKDYRKSLAYLNTAMDIALRFEQMAEEDTSSAASAWNQQQFEERLATLYHYQGSLRNRLGEPYRALESFERSMALDSPYSASLYTDQAISFAQLQENEKAEKLYIKAIQTDSAAEEAYYNLALLRQKQKLPDKADSLLEISLRVAPKNVQGWVLKGNLHLTREQYVQAIEYYDNAVSIDTASEEAYFQRGVANSRLLNAGRAEDDWTRAIEINPSNGDSYRNRGIVRLRQEKFEQALEDFNKAFELLGNMSDLYLNRGFVMLMLERPAEALEDIEKVLATEPESSDTYLLAAAAHKALKNKNKACTYFREAIEKGADPDQAERWFRRKCL